MLRGLPDPRRFRFGHRVEGQLQLRNLGIEPRPNRIRWSTANLSFKASISRSRDRSRALATASAVRLSVKSRFSCLMSSGSSGTDELYAIRLPQDIEKSIKSLVSGYQHDHHAATVGRLNVCAGRCQSIPSNSIDNCAALNRTRPFSALGHTK